MKFLIVVTLSLALAKASSFTLDANKVQGEGRISNGQNAKIGQFPYQVGISSKRSNGESFWCGASLISNEWLLTAAHCTQHAVEVEVFLGATLRVFPDVKLNVKADAIISHPKWNPKTDTNDICLIKIPAVEYTANIKSIQLPKKKAPIFTYVGEKTLASGWGRIASDKPGIVNILQWIRMEVISNEDCKLTYGNKISSFKLCTSTTGGTSTCQGDSGGPLALEDGNVLIGVASLTSQKGCDKGSPAIFTSVFSHLPWIEKHTGISY